MKTSLRIRRVNEDAPIADEVREVLATAARDGIRLSALIMNPRDIATIKMVFALAVGSVEGFRRSDQGYGPEPRPSLYCDEIAIYGDPWCPRGYIQPMEHTLRPETVCLRCKGEGVI